jgi:outer membrane murein-binding lipoprotein Lpp
MSQKQHQGALSRKIEEAQNRIDQLIQDRQALSDRVKASTDESKGGTR